MKNDDFYIFHDGFSLKISKKYFENGTYWFQTHIGKLKCSCINHSLIEKPIVEHKNGGIGVLLSTMYDNGLYYGVYWTEKSNCHKYPNCYYWNKSLDVKLKYETFLR